MSHKLLGNLMWQWRHSNKLHVFVSSEIWYSASKYWMEFYFGLVLYQKCLFWTHSTIHTHIFESFWNFFFKQKLFSAHSFFLMPNRKSCSVRKTVSFLTGAKVIDAFHSFENSVAPKTEAINTKAVIFYVCLLFSILQAKRWRWKKTWPDPQM